MEKQLKSAEHVRSFCSKLRQLLYRLWNNFFFGHHRLSATLNHSTRWRDSEGFEKDTPTSVDQLQFYEPDKLVISSTVADLEKTFRIWEKKSC